MNDLRIRPVTPDDAPALAEIYGYYVKNTAVSFEYDPPSAGEFRGRIAHTLEKYPYLSAVMDGRVIGYAYAREFVGRKACEHCVEVSVYVAHDCRRSGAGRALYEAMEQRLGETGILNVYASIAYAAFMSAWGMPHAPASTAAAINSATGTTSSGWRRCCVRIRPLTED